jgi:ABC-type iron transport system FetAB permease component
MILYIMIYPLSLLPIEITTLMFTLFRIYNHDNIIEFITSYFAFILHIFRFKDNFHSIIRNSKLNWKYCLIISICIGYVLYSIFYTNTSLLLLLMISSICQIFSYYIFEKTSNHKFKWFELKLDIPILFLSSLNSYFLYKKNNRLSIIWLSDVIYHIWEFIFKKII